MTESAEERGWLLISVSTAGAASTLRVQVWRKLRSLGALYLQQSVCLLPDREQPLRQVRRLLDRVRQQGGTGRLLHVALTDQAEERQVVGEFNAARDAEYAEVVERLPALRQELARERERGKATYAEAEESEADLERFRSWMAKIAARDYFAAPAGAAARAAVEEAAADLAAFEQDALAAEAPAGLPVAVLGTTALGAGELGTTAYGTGEPGSGELGTGERA
ncbi:Chromate resistance protein ChrB [Nonomuraea aurantiaca]|uniref:Chromate resistance protein ChrB n=1 Tax=Nonomuraea aurantiaca TaxID=2878562 RepID=UPI001CD9EE54|nr:Chromate resistance protein ChrB [Nonomuraea aurantiaca]MCA2226161.1 ChrB domain-containing protein [Nonomuraea aurantiaca]